MPAMRAVSCSVLLTPNHSWNGPLLTIAGSNKWFVSCVGETPANHHEVSLRRQEIGVPDDESLAELARRGELRECTGQHGHVVVFEERKNVGEGKRVSVRVVSGGCRIIKKKNTW